MTNSTTIAAISTGRGGAIAIIRISGREAIQICENIFVSNSGTTLSKSKGFTLHYGTIYSSGGVIDDVVVSLYRAPRSYTGEDMVEISCHDSEYIKSQILSLAIHYGATPAQGGEFTMRAYANGKMDLVQAEAVADILASDSQSSHRLALNQMRGGYSNQFAQLRAELIHLMSLLELELDFSDEDVEFADRTQLTNLVTLTNDKIITLTKSFAQGNVIKNGVPVAITGSPNVGKSTLLNALLNDDRAIVSPIAGTTRDIIEEQITLGDIRFRFIDTAGIRQTEDQLENLGIERTLRSVSQASLILFVVTAQSTPAQILEQLNSLDKQEWQNLIILLNKCDEISDYTTLSKQIAATTTHQCLALSAKQYEGIEELKSTIKNLYAHSINENDIIITNLRHQQLLTEAKTALERVLDGIQADVPTDFIAQDLRESLHHIGTLTGEISTNEVLQAIFANHCIGK